MNRLYKVTYKGEYGDNTYVLASNIKEAIDKSSIDKEIIQISLITESVYC